MKPFYRPELDALRFCAFLAVFAHHLLPENPSLYHKLFPEQLAHFVHNAVFIARYGVVLFFMLSSYLITSLLIREHDKTRTIDVRQFYIRRILRIWPLYFAFVAFCLFVWPHLRFPSLELHHYVGLATFTENISIIGWGWGDNPSALLWSVAVEEQFYLVWPVLMLVAGFARIPWIAIACFAVAFLSRLCMFFQGASDSQIWFATTSHIDAIAIGALIAYRNPGKSKSTGLYLYLMGASVTFLVVLCRDPLALNTVGYPLAVLACALLIRLTIGRDIGKSRFARSVIYLGRISFGLYVFHIAVQQLVVRYCGTLVLQFGLTLAVTVAVAALSYNFLELPFLQLKERFAVVPSRAP